VVTETTVVTETIAVTEVAVETIEGEMKIAV
jgi:hypothetical protein